MSAGAARREVHWLMGRGIAAQACADMLGSDLSSVRLHLLLGQPGMRLRRSDKLDFSSDHH
jgi:hypothetical protein